MAFKLLSNLIHFHLLIFINSSTNSFVGFLTLLHCSTPWSHSLCHTHFHKHWLVIPIAVFFQILKFPCFILMCNYFWCYLRTKCPNYKDLHFLNSQVCSKRFCWPKFYFTPMIWMNLGKHHNISKYEIFTEENMKSHVCIYEMSSLVPSRQ